MNERTVREALISLFHEGISHWQIIEGVAYALSMGGKTRLEIMRFYWDVMDPSSALTEAQVDLIGDFCGDLLGQCRLEHIIRLHGDPEDPHELAKKVAADVRDWRPPTGSTTDEPR